MARRLSGGSTEPVRPGICRATVFVGPLVTMLPAPTRENEAGELRQTVRECVGERENPETAPSPSLIFCRLHTRTLPLSGEESEEEVSNDGPSSSRSAFAAALEGRPIHGRHPSASAALPALSAQTLAVDSSCMGGLLPSGLVRVGGIRATRPLRSLCVGVPCSLPGCMCDA